MLCHGAGFYNRCVAELGRTILIAGLILAGLGAAILFASRLGLPLGRLPGDIAWRSRSGQTQVYFPIVTCIVLSVLFTLVSWLLRNLRR